MKLVTINKQNYNKFRIDAMFEAYKWDPQFADNNTVAQQVLVISQSEFRQLATLVEKLTAETLAAENFLNNNLKFAKKLCLPRQTAEMLKKMTNYREVDHIRLMRFDFHPIVGGGFAISEVNSDVPGGFAEASLLPKLAQKALENDNLYFENFGEILLNAIKTKIAKQSKIAFVHCTSYSDDRQVMQFLGDNLEKEGYRPIYCAADHIRFVDKKAFCILDGYEGEVDAIVRFTPLEWMIGTKKTWHGYFDTTTPSCNHPVSIFAQTKRFPLVWDDLAANGVDLTYWKKLLPETVEVKDAKGKTGFIFKPACGRVGEGISIKEACTTEEYTKILKDVARRPKTFVAQKRFESNPLTDEYGRQFHVCLGAYSVEGKAAGFYARISKTPRIDSNAADIAVLVEKD